MKFSESWLREWANPSLTREELGEKLTMAGLEIDELAPITETLFNETDQVTPVKNEKVSDYLIDVAITPNRGDCLSILGLAKEVSALTETPLQRGAIKEVPASTHDTLPVTIEAPVECPRYVGRVIRGVNANTIAPLYIRERLRIAGVRSISAIVDITNYVMLELGQPMHAFSLDAIADEIIVRMAKTGETLHLLDESEATLDSETLVIADTKKPLAIAGIMGGLESGVTPKTKDIFLESAFFKAALIAGTGRKLGIGSDSSYRFERGIDPTLQGDAIERATQLILEVAGGKPGPVIDIVTEYLPQSSLISLRLKRVAKILGYKVSESEIETIMHRLGFECQRDTKKEVSWLVRVPARRSDVTTEIDLIEEIARLSGYDKFPCHTPQSEFLINTISENKVTLQNLRRTLANLGYQEVITYSFIDKDLQEMFSPGQLGKPLKNPITADMTTMRTSLWPGLVNTLIYNVNRQQNRVRIFETGLRFIEQGNMLLQQRMLAGLVTGSSLPLQWGCPERQVDFFDLKGDLENLFQLTLAPNEFKFQHETHPALHPGQSAGIYRQGELVGMIGALHPTIAQALKIEEKVFVFEILLNLFEVAAVPRYRPLSKFPEIRRDIAILLDQTVPTAAIQDTIIEIAGDLLIDINIFDVYQGKGIEPGQKSIALALILQHASRTLVDEEVAGLMERVIVALKGRFNAELRG